MNKLETALRDISEMDRLAVKSSPVHGLSPLAKLLVTVAYIIVTVSFSKYQLGGLLIMIVYPLVMFSVSGISIGTCLYKLRIVLPLVVFVGLFNPIFDKAPMFRIGGVVVSSGVVSMITLMLKGVFCLMASRGLKEAACPGHACYAAASDLPLHWSPYAGGRGNERRLRAQGPGTEGHTHLRVGIFYRAAASAQHGQGRGSVRIDADTRVPR